MTVSKCAAQTVQTDTAVLKYLYKEAANAYYLKKDTANLNNIIILKDNIIVSKDSLISNRNEAIGIANNYTKLKELQIESSEKEVKSLTKKVAVFKTVSISVAILGAITTVVALFK